MASPDHARSNKSAGFLFFLGFALLAAGVGFALAPQYSWQVTKIARRAVEFGIHNGHLIVGGLTCFGLALVARAAGRAPALPDTRAESEALQSELHILNEQLSTKLAQIRASLVQLSEGVGSVSAQQQTMAQSAGSPRTDDHSNEAIFRLAASLDKLHAHLDERVHALDLQLRSSFESLLNASNDVRRSLAQGGVVGAAEQAYAPPSFGGADPMRAGGLALYETMQKLDAISGEAELASPLGRAPGHGPQPNAPLPSQGQGQELDLLLPEEYRDRY